MMWKLCGIMLITNSIFGMDIDEKPDVLRVAYNNLSFKQKQCLSQVLLDVKNGKKGPFEVLNNDMHWYHKTKKELENQGCSLTLTKLVPSSNAVLFSYGREGDPKNGFSVVLGSHLCWFTTQFIQNQVDNETNRKMESVYDSMFPIE